MARDPLWRHIWRLHEPSESHDPIGRPEDPYDDDRLWTWGRDDRRHAMPPDEPGWRHRDYMAFTEHRPPFLGPSESSRLMRGARPFAPASRHDGRGPGAGSVRRQRPSEGGRAAMRVERTDRRILEDVCDALAHEGWLDASGLEVTVDAQDVTLRGEVETREQKWLAEDCAEHVLGVRSVINRIRVRAREALVPERDESTAREDRENGHRRT